MDIDLARDVVRTAFRSSAELQALLGKLRAQCSDDEYYVYARGVAAAVDGIGAALINRVLTEHPELSSEIDDSIAKYGRYS